MSFSGKQDGIGDFHADQNKNGLQKSNDKYHIFSCVCEPQFIYKYICITTHTNDMNKRMGTSQEEEEIIESNYVIHLNKSVIIYANEKRHQNSLTLGTELKTEVAFSLPGFNSPIPVSVLCLGLQAVLALTLLSQIHLQALVSGLLYLSGSTPSVLHNPAQVCTRLSILLLVAPRSSR